MAHARSQVIDLTADDDGDEPPRKRPRTTTDFDPSVDLNLQVQGLNEFVFPKIELAIQHLPKGVYEEQSLTSEVLKRLFSDGSIKETGQRCQWKLSREQQNKIGAKVAEIVMKVRENFRRPANPTRSPSEAARPPSSASAISPSSLAHRPSSAMRSNSSTSQSPVPLPRYVQSRPQPAKPSQPASPNPLPTYTQSHVQQPSQGHSASPAPPLTTARPQSQQSSPPLPPTGQNPADPFPKHVLQKMMERASAASNQQRIVASRAVAGPSTSTQASPSSSSQPQRVTTSVLPPAQGSRTLHPTHIPKPPEVHSRTTTSQARVSPEVSRSGSTPQPKPSTALQSAAQTGTGFPKPLRPTAGLNDHARMASQLPPASVRHQQPQPEVRRQLSNQASSTTALQLDTRRRGPNKTDSGIPQSLPTAAMRSARPSTTGRPTTKLSIPQVTVDKDTTEQRRPYLPAKERREIAECVHNKRSAEAAEMVSTITFHVDLDDDELSTVKSAIHSLGKGQLSLDSIKNLHQRLDLATFLSSKLKGRNPSDMHNFLQDLPSFEESHRKYQVSLAKDDFLEQQRRRDRRLNTLRLDREMNGSTSVGTSMKHHSLQVAARKDLSDSIGHTIARFGQCSGDVATMAWVSDRSILCGATSTMDDRTLDHNKQGNLVLYSMANDTLEVFKAHRERRQAKAGESQDFSREKWLYPSVVASTLDAGRKLAFTAAFDRTVKIWNTTASLQTSMSVVGTWQHEGKVNFVAAAQNGSALVATAADVSSAAVRVYRVDPANPSASPYISLSCPRPDDQGTDEWGYWPATMQWGIAKGTQHLLAVGYSPRSRDGDENQIPEDKRRTGAILLWDSRTGQVLPAHANTVANVFEVVWHPTLPQLIVATSKSGLHVPKGVHTQIRIWKQDPDRVRTDQGWHEYKTLDCTAEDINELTVMPNSSHHAYITASCTSGEIFVWDTARGDQPIHILKHGPSIEPFENEEDMLRRDVGVKFTAWGHTADRLFTGSSDGKVNLWNIRKKHPFVRTVMQGEGAIFCGAFSPDKKKLAIGDGPGTVWLLTDPDEYPESWGKTCHKRHIPYVPDDEDGEDDELRPSDGDEQYHRLRWLDTGELRHSGNPLVGMVQGPSYKAGIYFDLKSHLNGDKTAPLIPAVERQQQAALRATPRRKRSIRRLKFGTDQTRRTLQLHQKNRHKDFDPENLDRSALEDLRRQGVELVPPEEDFEYESE